MVTLLAWRWRRTLAGAARTTPPSYPKLVRAAQPLPEPRPAIARPQEVHLHLHGVSAEDAAAIIRRAAAGPPIEEEQARTPPA